MEHTDNWIKMFSDKITDGYSRHGKIYKVVDKKTGEIVYIGSTKCTYLRGSDRNKGNKQLNWDVIRYPYSRYKLNDWPECDIELIENYSCMNKQELEDREQWYINRYMPKFNVIIKTHYSNGVPILVNKIIN